MNQIELFPVQDIPWEATMADAAQAAKERAVAYVQKLPKAPLRAEYPKLQNKWMLASALQKAIRRGYVEEAAHLTGAFFDLDKQYLIYRMATIACEDVGMANFDAIEAFSAVADNIDIRKGRERQIYAQLSSAWASGTKDRCATELLVLNEHGTASQRGAADSYRSSMTLFRSAEHQLKYGRQALIQFWLKREGCPRVLYVTDLLLRRQRTMIPVGLMPIARVAGWDGNQLPNSWTPDTYPWPCQKVGPFTPASACDKHTREGKRSIAVFCNKLGIENKAGAGMVIFTSEGSLVDKRLTYPGCELMVAEAKIAIDAIPEYSNLSRDEANDILATFVENVDLLHELREWAYRKG
jgi:hypothetical protein